MDKYTCPRCKGKGVVIIPGELHETCGWCHGTGKKQITIPLEEYDLLKKKVDELELALGIC